MALELECGVRDFVSLWYDCPTLAFTVLANVLEW